MGEGWSQGRVDLIPSNEPTSHPDRRMHWKIGAGDLDPGSIKHRDRTTEPPRELSDRELLRVAVNLAQQRLHDLIEATLAELHAELRSRV